MLTGSHGLWRIRVADYRSCAPSMISDAWYALPPKAIAVTPTSADLVIPVAQLGRPPTQPQAAVLQ